MSLARLDHIIYSVPDIEASHRELTAAFPEAWPVGRYWPDGLTSGVAIGGLNVELIQFDTNPSTRPVGSTLVFQPINFDQAVEAFARAGLPAIIVNKEEADPELLRRRGFDEQSAQTKQWICRNLVPEAPESLPFDFFVCEYSPFLERWLSPANPRLDIAGQVMEIQYGTAEPDQARGLLAELGYCGEIGIRFVGHDDRCIIGIDTSTGPLGWP